MIPMFGPSIRAISEKTVAKGILAFQLTGSPLQAVIMLLGPILSASIPNSRGNIADV